MGVSYIDIWYTFLTSVHYNLENLERGLAILIEGFSPLILNYTTSFVKVQIRGDVPSHTIPDTVYLPRTLKWAKLV